jgi:hypothetical protein
MNIQTNGHSVTGFRTDFDADQHLIDVIVKRLKDGEPLTVEDVYRASFKTHWPPRGLKISKQANKTPVKIVIQKTLKEGTIAEYHSGADEVHLNGKALIVRKSGIALMLRNIWKKFTSAKRSTFKSVSSVTSHEVTHGQSFKHGAHLLNLEFIHQHVIDPSKDNPAFKGMKEDVMKNTVYLSSLCELIATLQQLCPLAYEFSPNPKRDFFNHEMPTCRHSFTTMLKRCGVNIEGKDTKPEEVFAGKNYDYYSSIFDSAMRPHADPIAELVNARIMPVIRAMPDKKDREVFVNDTLPYLYGLLVEYWGDGAGRHYMGYTREATNPFMVKPDPGLPPGYFKPKRNNVTLYPASKAGGKSLVLSF